MPNGGKMRAAVLTGKDKIVLEEVLIPQLSRGEVLIKVKDAGICGSDMDILTGKHPRAKAPLVMGHEFSGIVAEKKSINSKIVRGDRVVVKPVLSCGECYSCRAGNPHVCQNLRLIGIDVDGAFAEYVKVPIEKVYKIPKDVSFEMAALIEPLAVAIHAVRSSSLKVGDFVVVLGGGPIGLLTSLIAKAVGATVIITEISKYRLQLAQKMGLKAIDAKKGDSVVSEIIGLANNIGADVVFEAAGSPITVKQITPIARIKGKVVLVGVNEESSEVNLLNMTLKELTLLGSRLYSDNDFQKAILMVAGEDLDLSPLISHKIKLEDIKEGFKLMENSDTCMKILMEP